MRWMVVALVGCGSSGSNGQDGGAGAVGPQGPAGADGAPGAPGGGYRWVDATGEAVTVGPDLVFVDEAGMFWGVDPETAELTVAEEETAPLFDTDNCSGGGWVMLYRSSGVSERVPPRFVVGIDGDTFARADTQRLGRFFLGWRRDDEGACVPNPYGTGDSDGFAVDDMIEVERPSVSWTGPLHPEPITP